MSFTASAFPKFYRRRLAGIIVFKVAKEIALRSLSIARRILCRMSPGCELRTYLFMHASDYDAVCDTRRQVIDATGSVSSYGPRFHNGDRFGFEDEGGIDIPQPQLSVRCFEDATITGCTCYSLVGGYAIYPDQFDRKHDYSPAQNFGYTSIDDGVTDVQMVLDVTRRESALTLLAQNNRNYAHFVTETLPRLVLANQVDEYRSLSLVIEEGLHPSHMEAISMLNVTDRAILLLAPWDQLEVGQLVDISLPAYEPYIPDRYGFSQTREGMNGFSRYALDALRSAMTEAVSLAAGEVSEQAVARKIYFARSTDSELGRLPVPNDAIEELMLANGFDIIDVRHESIASQVRICLQAETIVAPVGASLANMVFAPAGCRVVALAPFYRDGNYYYYSNLAATLGHELEYFLGQPEASSINERHRNYSLDIDALSSMMASKYSDKQ